MFAAVFFLPVLVTSLLQVPSDSNVTCEICTDLSLSLSFQVDSSSEFFQATAAGLKELCKISPSTQDACVDFIDQELQFVLNMNNDLKTALGTLCDRLHACNTEDVMLALLKMEQHHRRIDPCQLCQKVTSSIQNGIIRLNGTMASLFCYTYPLCDMMPSPTLIQMCQQGLNATASFVYSLNNASFNQFGVLCQRLNICPQKMPMYLWDLHVVKPRNHGLHLN